MQPSSTADITKPPRIIFKVCSVMDADVEGAATMKSAIIKRSVVVNGHKTSISLEDAFWSEVKAIASEKHTTISELLTDIDRDRQASNLSSALRVFVLRHHQSTPEATVGRTGG